MREFLEKLLSEKVRKRSENKNVYNLHNQWLIKTKEERPG